MELAVRTLQCPVIANGNVVDPATALAYHGKTNAADATDAEPSVTHGSSAITRAFQGKLVKSPTHRDLLEYIMELSTELPASTRRSIPSSMCSG